MLSDKLCQPINGATKPNRATSPLRRVVDIVVWAKLRLEELTKEK